MGEEIIELTDVVGKKEETREETIKRFPMTRIDYPLAFLWGGLIFLVIGFIFFYPQVMLIGMIALAIRVAYIFKRRCVKVIVGIALCLLVILLGGLLIGSFMLFALNIQM